MRDPLRNDPLDVLGNAYESLYEHVAKNFHNAEEKTDALFHKLLDEVKQEAGKIKELSVNESEEIADWIKRDIVDLQTYLNESGNELKDWLGFETNLVENEFLDLLLKAADQTTIKLLQMKVNVYLTSAYHSGEIVSPGTFSCDHCDQRLTMHRSGRIPVCSNCKATNFHRFVKRN